MLLYLNQNTHSHPHKNIKQIALSNLTVISASMTSLQTCRLVELVTSKKSSHVVFFICINTITIKGL